MIDPSHRAAAVRPSLLFLFFFFGLPGFQLGFHRARPSVEIPARFFICLFFLAYLGVCVKWEGISMDRVSIDQLFFSIPFLSVNRWLFYRLALFVFLFSLFEDRVSNRSDGPWVHLSRSFAH